MRATKQQASPFSKALSSLVGEAGNSGSLIFLSNEQAGKVHEVWHKQCEELQILLNMAQMTHFNCSNNPMCAGSNKKFQRQLAFVLSETILELKFNHNCVVSHVKRAINSHRNPRNSDDSSAEEEQAEN